MKRKEFDWFWIVALVALIALALILAPTAGAQEKPKMKTVPVKVVDRTSGPEMYRSYCASCHGLSGKGDGPAAPALKAMPTDLTALAKANGGAFPTLRVNYVLSMATSIPAHGSKDMPVWGVLFREMESGSAGFTRLRIQNLLTYLESIQAK